MHAFEARRPGGASRLRMLLMLVVMAAATGCASQPTAPADASPAQAPEQATTTADVAPTVVSYAPPDDPLEPVNRAIFAFNDVTYRYALIPLARGYQAVVPRGVRTSVGNVFDNIGMPVRLVNHLIQLKPKAAGIDLARFVVNTTVGLGGLFDPADAWLGLADQPTGFAETLRGYGTGQGTFIVLPFYGPSDLRAGSGLVVDYLLNPIPYVLDQPEATVVNAFDAFQEYAPTAPRYAPLWREADDPYVFFRNLYWQGQRRDAEYDGEGFPGRGQPDAPPAEAAP